ncbi:XdhC family protein [Nocardia huaxiensis]|uniref:XdhC family protein n=1 Tax=Nocardia huaxiensis TaxID=2755382 RepID=UPI001E4B00EA|nr:XdhC family protein [Nocardia huaxiensis]UFS97612.1 XdhC family protein [Nocardia huaxiensis]
MRDIAAQLLKWHAAHQPYAIASIISIGGSAPRPVGAALAVNAGGEVVGSISGGCVEGAVYELCRDALETGETLRETFGYSDSDAFAVGLTCGGTIEVLVQPVTDANRAALEAMLRAEGSAALVRDVHSGEAVALGDWWSVGTAFTETVVAEARAMLDAGATGLRTLGCGEDEVTVFVESHVPPPRMIVFGAIDFAGAVARIGKFLGYHVTVCDARPVFATRARFPEADDVVVEWPDRYLARTRVDARTVLCVLTHDAKFDVPLLEVALRLPVAFVGAMGSRRTHEDRTRRLREAGVTAAELARLRSPIGLDLGGRTPEETAVSIAAEIVALRRGGSGLPLTLSGGPIHRDSSPLPDLEVPDHLEVTV